MVRLARPHAARELVREYRPWSMQRKFHRSPAPIRVVAGRQAGKTHAAAEEVVRLVMARPETESCLLMPTYKSTKAALRHLRRAVAVLGTRARWKEVDKCFTFPNGSLLYVRTAEDKEGVPNARPDPRRRPVGRRGGVRSPLSLEGGAPHPERGQGPARDRDRHVLRTELALRHVAGGPAEWGLAVGQRIYTPEHLDETGLVADDRPPGGTLLSLGRIGWS